MALACVGVGLSGARHPASGSAQGCGSVVQLHRQFSRTQARIVVRGERPSLAVCCALDRDRGEGFDKSRPEGAAFSPQQTVSTDGNVPEAHQGLHSFLYGEDADSEHRVSDAEYTLVPGEDDGTSLTEVGTWLSAREGRKLAGVFAIYDGQRSIQFIGISRHIVSSLRQHVARREGRCSFVRVQVHARKEMISKARLLQIRSAWLAAEAEIPPGNAAESALWDDCSREKSMSEKDQVEYEEKKFKLRKAMGENIADDVDGESDAARQRRLQLVAATEGDDWSHVIDSQTLEVQQHAVANNTGEGVGIVSPFLRVDVHTSFETDETPLALTLDSVDSCLDDVRPYLKADGGNVKVLGVEGGIVTLELEGACGTCPSSSATMKMGIEKALDAKFGHMLRGVVQLGGDKGTLTVAAIDSHLDILRSAIGKYGGIVEVCGVDDRLGTCTIKYVGPPAIGSGIRTALKDKFPRLRRVDFVED